MNVPSLGFHVNSFRAKIYFSFMFIAFLLFCFVVFFFFHSMIPFSKVSSLKSLCLKLFIYCWNYVQRLIGWVEMGYCTKSVDLSKFPIK